jgi:hypothetical protein
MISHVPSLTVRMGLLWWAQHNGGAFKEAICFVLSLFWSRNIRFHWSYPKKISEFSSIGEGKKSDFT